MATGFLISWGFLWREGAVFSESVELKTISPAKGFRPDRNQRTVCISMLSSLISKMRYNTASLISLA